MYIKNQLNMSDLNRRAFLKTSMLGAAGAFIGNRMLGSEKLSPLPTEKKQGKVVTRKLGNTGIELPVVSFGVMRADNPALVHAALDAGFRHFDTAHVYQNGNNEKMLGEELKEYPRDSFTIATKVPPEEKDRKTGKLLSGSTKKAFLDKLDTSLERLKMDYVDILYAHSISSRQAVEFEPILDALKTAKKQGKAKHIGLSTHSNEVEVIEAAIEMGVHEVILTAYNFKQDHKEKLGEMIAKASKAGIGIVGMKSMAGGDLGKNSDQPVNFKAALKWALNNPHVHTTIPGIINFKQMKENFSVMEDLSLTSEEKNFIHAASAKAGLYCNGCNTCTDSCRKGLPIPDLMRAHMYAYGYREMKKAREVLDEHQVHDNPCKDCAVCTASCVKGFDLPARLADISRMGQVPEEFLV